MVTFNEACRDVLVNDTKYRINQLGIHHGMRMGKYKRSLLENLFGMNSSKPPKYIEFFNLCTGKTDKGLVITINEVIADWIKIK